MEAVAPCQEFMTWMFSALGWQGRCRRCSVERCECSLCLDLDEESRQRRCCFTSRIHDVDILIRLSARPNHRSHTEIALLLKVEISETSRSPSLNEDTSSTPAQKLQQTGTDERWKLPPPATPRGLDCSCQSGHDQPMGAIKKISLCTSHLRCVFWLS